MTNQFKIKLLRITNGNTTTSNVNFYIKYSFGNAFNNTLKTKEIMT